MRRNSLFWDKTILFLIACNKLLLIPPSWILLPHRMAGGQRKRRKPVLLGQAVGNSCDANGQEMEGSDELGSGGEFEVVGVFFFFFLV